MAAATRSLCVCSARVHPHVVMVHGRRGTLARTGEIVRCGCTRFCCHSDRGLVPANLGGARGCHRGASATRRDRLPLPGFFRAIRANGVAAILAVRPVATRSTSSIGSAPGRQRSIAVPRHQPCRLERCLDSPMRGVWLPSPLLHDVNLPTSLLGGSALPRSVSAGPPRYGARGGLIATTRRHWYLKARNVA